MIIRTWFRVTHEIVQIIIMKLTWVSHDTAEGHQYNANQQNNPTEKN